jgi:uncharacterized membrane protein YfcA
LSALVFVLLGLVVGVLSSGSGLGGGFLVVPLLIYLGSEAKAAVGTSFVVVLLIAISALAAHYRLGHVDLKTGLLLALGGMVGAQLGPNLLKYISDAHFKQGFAVLMVATGVWMFINARA